MVPPSKHLLPNAHGAIAVEYDFTEDVDGVPVRFLFGEGEGGQLVCFRIEIGASLDPRPGGLTLDNIDALRVQPVTTQTLRRIPVASMIEAHLLKLHQRIRDGEYLPHARETLEDRSTRIPDSDLRRLELEIGARAKRSAPSYRRPGRPQKYSREHYEEVARVYRAHSGGRSPQRLSRCTSTCRSRPPRSGSRTSGTISVYRSAT